MNITGKHPNILLCMLDHQRYPVCDATLAVQLFQKKDLKAQEPLRERGIDTVKSGSICLADRRMAWTTIQT